MNTKSIHFGLGRVTLAIAGLLIATFNLSADPGITAHIPFAFVASGKSLPAGEYKIEPLSTGVVRITGGDPTAGALLLVTTTAASGSPGITFDRSGPTPQLTGVQSSLGTWQFLNPAISKSGPAAALRSKK